MFVSRRLWIFIFVCFFSVSCSKFSSAKGIVKESDDISNSEIDKLWKVKSLMSDRFNDEFCVNNDNAKEFINELNGLLDEERAFRRDDLSLFYLIDKKHTVSSDYVPKNLVKLEKNEYFNINRNDLSLRPDVYEALKDFSIAANKEGIKLLVSSTYRSFEYQKNLFAKWVKIDGLEEAERESARPGTSQHQLGSVIDFGSITDDFAETKMGKWIYENASNYGWSLSFPRNYEDVTGYRWECWHFRYIGKNACEFQKKWFNNVQQYMLEFINAWENN